MERILSDGKVYADEMTEQEVENQKMMEENRRLHEENRALALKIQQIRDPNYKPKSKN